MEMVLSHIECISARVSVVSVDDWIASHVYLFRRIRRWSLDVVSYRKSELYRDSRMDSCLRQHATAQSESRPLAYNPNSQPKLLAVEVDLRAQWRSGTG